MGYMSSVLDPVSSAFIDFAAKSSYLSLEIGAAYGVATIEALKKGATVIANDLDERHLKILKERTPAKFRSRLKVQIGRFPNELRIEDNSLGGILISRVCHFLSAAEIESGFERMFQWLRSNGRVFVIAETSVQNL